MIAASRLAEVDRELEAFGVEASKLEALRAALRQRPFSAEEVDAFLGGAEPVRVDTFVERVSSDAIAVDLDEVIAREARTEEAPVEAAPVEAAPVEALAELPAVETSVTSLAEVDALEAAAPSQEIELDEDVIVSSSPQVAPAPVSISENDEDMDFPTSSTELIVPGARELELEFDGDLSMGSEPLHFETPATGTTRSVRPSRAPLSQADLDAELAAILADPDDRASDASELAERQSLIDVEVDMSSDELSAESSDAIDVTDVADVTSEEAGPPTTSTRPPPLPSRPSSIAPPPDDSPGFLGRLLNKK